MSAILEASKKVSTTFWRAMVLEAPCAFAAIWQTIARRGNGSNKENMTTCVVLG